MAAEKRLILALDVSGSAEAARWTRLLGGEIGVFKIGLELFISQGPKIIKEVRQAGAEAIFLDLKLHDIPATMRAAARQAADLGVDFLTCHCEQTDIFTGMDLAPTRLLGITVLTSLEDRDLERQGYSGDLSRPLALARRRAQLALEAGCQGIVCSGHEAGSMRRIMGPEALIVCPGIRLSQDGPDDQKRIATPGQALAAGASHLVVGRPILRARDPLAAARDFAKAMQAPAPLLATIC
ncbi:MAG: orotidine-5'-phosphate decarboxylase [Desulfarculales bacterium]|nr:orotidine-5'-phosphate decarboxylase [Desulfarculales bacterium]